MLDLAPIQARLLAATPGPWDLFGNGTCSEIFAKTVDCLGTEHPGERLLVLDDETYQTLGIDEQGDGFGPDQALADAVLIANSPTDIANLLAEVNRLTEDRGRLMEAIRAHRKYAYAANAFDRTLWAVIEGEVTA